MLRQDYIGRLIQQMIEALGRAAKLLRDGQVDEAEGEVSSARDALGLPRGIELFDPRSAAMVIGSGDKVVLAALLLEHEALLASRRGGAARARRMRERALALLDHCRPHELSALAAELRVRLGEPPP